MPIIFENVSDVSASTVGDIDTLLKSNAVKPASYAADGSGMSVKKLVMILATSISSNVF